MVRRETEQDKVLRELRQFSEGKHRFDKRSLEDLQEIVTIARRIPEKTRTKIKIGTKNLNDLLNELSFEFQRRVPVNIAEPTLTKAIDRKVKSLKYNSKVERKRAEEKLINSQKDVEVKAYSEIIGQNAAKKIFETKANVLKTISAQLIEAPKNPIRTIQISLNSILNAGKKDIVLARGKWIRKNLKQLIDNKLVSKGAVFNVRILTRDLLKNKSKINKLFTKDTGLKV